MIESTYEWKLEWECMNYEERLVREKLEQEI